jgi:hypothetical protein
MSFDWLFTPAPRFTGGGAGADVVENHHVGHGESPATEVGPHAMRRCEHGPGQLDFVLHRAEGNPICVFVVGGGAGPQSRSCSPR